MSATRTTTSYRALRNLLSSPYARPSALLNSLYNRLRGNGNTPNREATFNNGALPSTEEVGQNEGPAEDVVVNLMNNAGEPPHVDAEPGPAPVTISSGGSGDEGARSLPATPPSVEGISTPIRNLQTVSAFLAQKGDQPLNIVECAGLVSLLQGSVVEEDEPREPFRFSSSSAATTPAFTFVPTSSSAPAFPGMTSAPQASKKLLTKNPNGPYRWHGGGSARPRNRYQSPAFGPSGSAPSRMKIHTENPITTKRRRVEEPPTSSTINSSPATTSLPPPQEGPSTTNPTAPMINGTAPSMSAPASAASTSRPAGHTPSIAAPTIRTNNLPPKVSAPAVPSPLRQTWGQNDPPSPPQAAPISRPTRAANIMTEIIKEAAPRPKPAFHNPYQAACPVPLKPTTRKPLPRKARVAPTKPTPAPKEVELSPQKIIEATVPKGSKRLRPPPGLDSQPRSQNDSNLSSSPRRKSPEPFRPNGINGISRLPNGHSMKRSSVQIEEVPDEDMASPPKKQKPAPPAAPKLSARVVPPPVIIEEVEDVDMPAKVERPSQIVEPDEAQPQQRSTSPTSSLGALPNGNAAAKAAFGLKSSAPKAPSKLRYSFQAEKEEGEKSQSKNQGSFPFTFGAASAKPSFNARPALKTKEEVRTMVTTMAVANLPTFAFDIPTSSPGAGPGPSSQKSRNAAMATSKTSLPTYDFSAPTPVASFSIPATAPSPAPARVPTSFNWTAAGMKAPTQQSAGGTWTCSQCMLSNPDSAKDQCTICEAPRPGKAKPAPAPTAFNWSAAGMKAPTQAAGGTWTCSQCMLSNPDSARDQCTVCEAPRPGKAKPAPAPTAFNWSAAGMKAPTQQSAGGTWTCSQCMLSNPDSATSQCTICEAPRPGKAASAPAVKAFDWAAAGMKKPEAASTGSWTCSVCALSNPASATDKCTVCDTPR